MNDTICKHCQQKNGLQDHWPYQRCWNKEPKMNYTLIYKLDSYDEYCRGCFMETYYGDSEIIFTRDRDEAARRWAELEIREKGHPDQEKTIILLINGIPEHEMWNIEDDPMLVEYRSIEALKNQMIEKINAERAEAEKQQKERERAAKEARALAKAEQEQRLTAEYGPAR